MTAWQVRIRGRYTGPPDSANGGYACAIFAQEAAVLLSSEPGDLAVTLHAPPPIDTLMRVEATPPRVHVWHDDDLIATVREAHVEVGAIEPIDVVAAEQASLRFAGRNFHPFPSCFVCGTARPDDGLHLSPGPVAGRPGLVACTWLTPPGSVPAHLAWAVLDCTGGWLVDQAEEPMVLAHLAVKLARVVPPDEKTVVVGRLDSRHEHGAAVTTMLFQSDGVELGRAHATWSPRRR